MQRIFFSLAILFSLGGGVSVAWAAPIDYGDFLGTSVRYLAVTEDSATDPPPLFNAPVLVGDGLDFNPTFGSSSSGAGASDDTNGTLTFGIEALPGSVIDRVAIGESGDFTLTGFGGAGTGASVHADVTLEIDAVDGAAPAFGLSTTEALVFSPSNGDWNLLDDGPGPLVSGTWTGFLEIDVTQMLSDAGLSYVEGVTRVTLQLDNRLHTQSESGTAAVIGKKDFDGLSFTVIPEPSSWVLCGLGLSVLGGWRRRPRER